MSKAPTPQTKFQVAVHGGYHFTVGEGDITKRKLLLSVTDARREWVGWYLFVEKLEDVNDRAYETTLLARGSLGRAEKTIEFGKGAIQRAPIQLRHPRSVDRFGKEKVGSLPTKARIHDARFVAIPTLDGSGSGNVMRLELTMSFDLMTGTKTESVHFKVSMVSPERPNEDIHPAVGFLSPMGPQTYAKAQHGPGPDVWKALEAPV